MKRFISILLTVILLAGMTVVPGGAVSAADIKTGTLVTFGSYPQSRVTNSSLLKSLNSRTLSWTYYDYYCDYKQEDYMEYADTTFSGERYRAVRFRHYRPYSTISSSLSIYTYQDDNGYEPGETYWFKYEPILWRVLDPDAGLLLTEYLIDSQPFNNEDKSEWEDGFTHYANNWAFSSLRSWMNEDFYNTAFHSEKDYINDAFLDTPSDNGDSDQTTDKVFLLSKLDAKNESYGFSTDLKSDTNRIAYGTDYAKCQGLDVKDYSNDESKWRLRTPDGNNWIYQVNTFGDIDQDVFITGTDLGIRPALYVDLQSAIDQSIIKINDTDPPSGSISSTNNVAESQTVTLSKNDNVSIAGYYWGTLSEYADNPYVETGSENAEETVYSPGTYYFTVMDNCGNVSPSYPITFYRTSLNANGGSVSPTSVLTAGGESFMIPTPTRQNYSFDGWYYSVNGGSKMTTSVMTPSENSTLYAHWTPVPKNTYTVKYDANGGSDAPSEQNKTEGEPLTLTPDKPSKTYTITYEANGGDVSPQSRKVSCTFNSWNTKKDGSGTTYKPGANYTTDADATLYAQWKNPTAGELATPTRSGYNFDGWYTSASGGTKVTSSSTISANTRIYAHWTAVPKNTYTVNYDANGGNGAPSKQNKTEGEPLTLTSDKPSKTYTITYDANGGNVSPQSRKVSCVFNSWNTKKDGSGTTYKPGGTYSSDANATLYAQWKNPTAGELETPTRSGYNFDGWYTSASGGTKVTSSSTISANTTVYAHWTAVPKNTYTVNYDANGGNGAPSAQTKTEGKTLTLNSSKPSKSYKITYNANNGSVSPASKSVNCTFGNWNTKKDGSGTVYHSGGSYTKDSNATLYAQWKNPTAGTLATPTRSGYTFDGWYTSASGGTKVTSSTTISANTTVYAHWTAVPKNTYTIKYDANGGSGAPSAQTKTEGKTLTLNSAEPSKLYKITYNANNGSVSATSKTVSCAFVNWNTKKDGSGTVYNPGGSYTKDSNATLYAQWKNPTAGTLATPTRPDYTFDGWYTSASGGTKVTSSSTISSNITVYAHWTKQSTPPTPTSPFVWGTDNWNFVNSTKDGDFASGTYRKQINSTYLDKLKENLTNTEYQEIFKGIYIYGTYYPAWLDEEWGGSCYGMSSTTLLAKQGLLPYSQYKKGATKLNELARPTANNDVSSLITYYQMLQIKDVIQQQYRTVPYRSNETNIKQIISLLDKNPTVLIGFQKKNWGGHAILAYGYEYGSFTYNGVTYQGCIKICDPNASKAYDASCNIYFNTQSYQWAIPFYNNSGITSAQGAVFNYVGANVDEINRGGYLNGSTGNKADSFIARINAFAIGENRSVSKVQQINGNYTKMNAGPDDIIEDYSYILGNESEGTFGYNLRDGESAYIVSQDQPDKLELSIDYENCFLTASSAAGKSVTFDNRGFVEVSGESAAYTMSMTFDDDYPTDWFTVQVSGEGANHASLEMTDEGYVVSGDVLKNVDVKTNNREQNATFTFSTSYPSALIYEINETTIGIKVDADGNGTYETQVRNEGIRGDANGDGEVLANDARLVLRASAKLEKLDDAAFRRCDLDGDGKLLAVEARLILRYSAKLETTI